MDDGAPWGGTQGFDDADEGDIVSNAIRKENVLRYVCLIEPAMWPQERRFLIIPIFEIER